MIHDVCKIYIIYIYSGIHIHRYNNPIIYIWYTGGEKGNVTPAPAPFCEKPPTTTTDTQKLHDDTTSVHEL